MAKQIANDASAGNIASTLQTAAAAGSQGIVMSILDKLPGLGGGAGIYCLPCFKSPSSSLAAKYVFNPTAIRCFALRICSSSRFFTLFKCFGDLCIGVGGLMLARLPAETVQERTEYFREQTRNQMTAVDENLMREQHPSMPIHKPDRQSRVTFGGKEKLSE